MAVPLLMELSGNLCLIDMTVYELLVEIWIVEDYNNYFWSKEFRININTISICPRENGPWAGISYLCRPLSIHSSGQLLVCDWTENSGLL